MRLHMLCTRTPDCEILTFPDARRTYHIDLDGYQWIARRGNDILDAGTREQCRASIYSNVALSMERM